MFDLNGKASVVTGGASGIGKAISLLFARRGAFVHLLDRDQENAKKLYSRFRKKVER